MRGVRYMLTARRTTGLLVAGLMVLSLSVTACSEDDNGTAPPNSTANQNNNQADPDAGPDADDNGEDPDADVGPDPDPDADVGPDPDADVGPDPDADVGPDPLCDGLECGDFCDDDRHCNVYGDCVDTNEEPECGDEVCDTRECGDLCDDDRHCNVYGQCVDTAEDPECEDEYPKEENWLCGPQVNLGELDLGETELDVDFDSFDNNLATPCETDSDSSAAIFRFSAPEGQEILGALTVDLGDGLAGEIRQFHCNDQDSETVTGCLDEGDQTILQSGMTYFLVLESTDDDPPTDPQASLIFEELEQCFGELGSTTCLDDSTIEACQLLVDASPDMPLWFTNECPSSECIDGVCAGDSCDNPIVVTDSFEWNGLTRGLFDNHNSIVEVDEAFDAGGDPTCLAIPELSDDGDSDGEAEPADTPGRDLVFEIVDLVPGQGVHIQIEYDEPDEFMILVKDECSDTAECLTARWQIDELLVPVEEEGSLFVFIDTVQDDDVEGEFDITIDVEDLGDD